VDEARIRRAVRGLVIDPHGDVLLVSFQASLGRIWILPGGGVEPGESDVLALERELAEEIGLVGAPIGPRIWWRRRLLPFADGSFDGQIDHIHVVRVPRFEPVPHLTADELLDEGVTGMRWWSRDEIAASDELFAPRSLASLLAQLAVDGDPSSALELSD
jgi:8-oxo-dGTP pyrophosphatase MutT (NUDIX family)